MSFCRIIRRKRRSMIRNKEDVYEPRFLVEICCLWTEMKINRKTILRMPGLCLAARKRYTQKKHGAIMLGNYNYRGTDTIVARYWFYYYFFFIIILHVARRKPIHSSVGRVFFFFKSLFKNNDFCIYLNTSTVCRV